MKDLTDAELDELGELLFAAPEPLQSLDVPMLDGYLVGVLVQPRRVEPDEWLPPVFDLERRPLPPDVDAAWLARCRDLIVRRFDALNEQIADFGRFDPVVADIDDLPPVSEYDAVQSPISRALLPWVVGFDWALQCFTDLEEGADESTAALLDRLWRHLPPEDDDAKALVQRLDAERPLKDIEAALDDLVLVCVDLWDRTVDRRYSVATRRRTAPKVGRNDPCPCGSGRKFKACHGRT